MTLNTANQIYCLVMHKQIIFVAKGRKKIITKKKKKKKKTVLSLEKGAYPKNVHTFLYCLIKLAFLSNIYVFGSFDKKKKKSILCGSEICHLDRDF